MMSDHLKAVLVLRQPKGRNQETSGGEWSNHFPNAELCGQLVQPSDLQQAEEASTEEEASNVDEL